MTAVKYTEKEVTLISGELVYVAVDIEFTCGFKGREPFAVIVYPDGTKYSADAATVEEFFNQTPDQHLVLTPMQLGGDYDRTQTVAEIDLIEGE